MNAFGLFLASIFSLLNLTQLAAVHEALFSFEDVNEATVLFAGDMMFDRSVRTAGERNGEDFLLSCVSGALADADLTVANLEGPITDNPSRSVGSAIGSPDNFIFTFPRSTAPLLKKHHIDLVSLGNNHILNFGYSGVRTTQEALQDAGVGYFGDPIGDTVTLRTVNGILFAFIAYNEFAPGGWRAAASSTALQIREAKFAGFVPIVFPHWGVEYEPLASEYQRTLAHQFVDAGAVAVIGAHPHVVQDHETYNGAPIYYSLGNFVFDQYFTEAVRNGIFVKITFNTTGATKVEEIPIVLNRDRTVCPAMVDKVI
ncbi:CapA family protein [Candidatus Parcubacteria bacterium]|nr:MAG: CapA family protein [Candidatus Parcubacteria bacterium]